MPRPRHLVPLVLVVCSSLLACKRQDSATPEDPSSYGYDSTSTSTSGYDSTTPSPTPTQVCRHLSQMIVAEIGEVDPAVQAATVDECVIEMTDEQQIRGPQQWDLVARCVLASSTEADIDRCDQLYPGPGGPPAAGVGAREQEACVYMIGMILYESGADTEAFSDAELEGMVNECLVAFDEDRRAMPSDQYQAMIDCFFRAQTVAQMEQCGS